MEEFSKPNKSSLKMYTVLVKVFNTITRNNCQRNIQLRVEGCYGTKTLA